MQTESSPSEPLRMTLSQVPTQGDRPRDVSRVVLRVEAHSACGIEGYYLAGPDKGKPTRQHFIEVYADRVKAVLDRVRTDEHRAAIKASMAKCDRLVNKWVAEKMDGFRGSEAKRSDFEAELRATCPLHWSQFLDDDFGIRMGVPPLDSCDVVNEDGKSIPAAKFVAMSRQEQQAFLKPPPVTPENATKAAMEQMADAIAQAITKAQVKK